jgi:hypothetical protein
MKRKIEAISIITLALILFMGLFAAACGGSGDSGEINGQSLLEDRCTGCHTLSRIKSAEKTREQWERTVDRMVAMGAELNSEERGILLDYLEATYSN